MISLYDGRQSLYQWDTNQKVVSSDFKVGDEIHFFNAYCSNALVTIAYEYNGKVVADIPNILLQRSSSIIVYKVVHDGGCSTCNEYTFVVNQRAKPESYIYTETETLSYKLLNNRLTTLEGEGLANAVAEYLEKNPIEAGATKEQAEQIKKNTESIERLSTDKLDTSELPTAINTALEQAKASGEFDGKDGKNGKDGYTPIKGVDYFDGKDGKNGQDGYTPQKGLDYFDGQNGKDGSDGKDGKTPVKGVDYYTSEDKQEIVSAVISTLPTWNGGSY